MMKINVTVGIVPAVTGTDLMALGQADRRSAPGTPSSRLPDHPLVRSGARF